MSANFEHAYRKAAEVLKENSVQTPPVPIVALAENYGLDIRSMDFGEFSSEISGYIDLDYQVVFVNENEAQVRQAFTIAHELGHYLLHKAQIKENPETSILLRQPLGAPNPDPMEQEANSFAAELLVPKELLKQYLDKGINEPNILASVFGVSQEVITYRLQDARLTVS